MPTPPTGRPRRRETHWTGPIAAVAAFAAGALPAFAPVRAADDAKEPKADESKVEVKEPKELKVVGPATRPTTGPASKPAVEVSPAVRAELDSMRDAYRDLKSLKLAAKFTADFDVNGEQHKNEATSEATFKAPNQFRHEMREAKEGKADQGEKGDKVDLVVGSTGDKLFVFDPGRKYYLMADAPKPRGPAEKLGKPVGSLLEEQNPSLMFALSDDASAEVLRDTKSVEKLPDVKVGDASYAALKLTGEKGGEMTMLIDPKTHLLRRVTTDLKASIPKQAGEVKKAEVTIDYTESAPGAGVKGDQFAWAPPPGAKDVTAAVAGGGGGGEEDGAAAAMEGKAAPDFKLAGADGKDVSLADLKGSVVILDFWATWCGPCRASLPHLNEIYNDKKEAGLKAYAVNLREGKEQVGKFTEQTKLTIPVLFDSDGKVAEKYGVEGIPQTVVIGKDGKVKKVVVGSGTHEQIRQAVEEAMK